MNGKILRDTCSLLDDVGTSACGNAKDLLVQVARNGIPVGEVAVSPFGQSVIVVLSDGITKAFFYNNDSFAIKLTRVFDVADIFDEIARNEDAS